MKQSKPVARTSGIVVLDTDGETLVYDLNVSEAHCLNEAAAFVWKACDGHNSLDDIGRLVKGRYQTSEPEEFVWLALDQLSERKLLAVDADRKPRYTSRREMLKRVGIASVAAVPVIASIVAPSSAYASASCACVNPGACLTQTQCPSQVNCNASGICAP